MAADWAVEAECRPVFSAVLCAVAGTGCLSGTSVRPHIFVGGEPGNRGNKIPPLPFDVHRLFFAIALIQDTETATEIKKERRRDKHVA